MSPTSVTPASAELLGKGQFYASLGKSAHAEQYYLAALEQGAAQETVYNLLIDTCVRSGRLRRALLHVEFVLRRQPDNTVLRTLAASLYSGLDQGHMAWSHIEELGRAKWLSPESLLFLARVYEREEGGGRLAQGYYRRYFAALSPEQQMPGTRAAYERLKSRGREIAPPSGEVSHEYE